MCPSLSDTIPDEVKNVVRITIFTTSFPGPFLFSSSREMRKSVNRASTDVERLNLTVDYG